MRHFKHSFGIVLLIITGLILFHFYHLDSNKIIPVGSNKTEVSSFESENDTTDGERIKARAAIVVDLDTGKILYSKNIHEKHYPASLTKLMTALILTEKDSPDNLLTYTADAKAQPSNCLNFSQGSTLTCDNAIHGMLIFSANDMATMAAENLSGNIDGFVTLMNEKAKDLGMNDTHFANPNGLPDEDHYSTAYDISLLARTVYKSDRIMDCLETPSAVVTPTDGKGVTVYNTNKALGKNGCFAGKTGFTTPAGYCLVAFYKKGGRTVVGVVLKSPDEKSLYSDMNKIISSSLYSTANIGK